MVLEMRVLLYILIGFVVSSCATLGGRGGSGISTNKDTPIITDAKYKKHNYSTDSIPQEVEIGIKSLDEDTYVTFRRLDSISVEFTDRNGTYIDTITEYTAWRDTSGNKTNDINADAYRLGKVSIGDNTAESALSISEGGANRGVDRTLTIQGAESDYKLTIQDGNGRVNQIWNTTAGNTPYTFLKDGDRATRFLMHSANNTENGIAFQFQSSDTLGKAGEVISWNETLAMTHKGYVGMGRISPNEKLHVNGRVRIDTVEEGSGSVLVYGVDGNVEKVSGIELGDTGNGKVATFNGDIDVTGVIDPTKILFSNAAGTNSSFNPTAEGEYQIEYTEGVDLNFKSNSTDNVLHLNNNGFVGIGTPSPIDKLHVESTDIGLARFQTSNASGRVRVLSQVNSGFGLVTDNTGFTLANYNVNGGTETDFGIYNDDLLSAALVVDGSNNNIGINRTVPQYPLDVGGVINSTTHIKAGTGSGGVGMTINDGYGNANLTFNHVNGVPDQSGTAARITVNVDGTAGVGLMEFKLYQSATNGVPTTTSPTAVGLSIRKPDTNRPHVEIPDALMIGRQGAEPLGALEVTSTTEGVLIPRMTEAQRNAILTPNESELLFNTTSDQFEFWDGSTWSGLAGTFNGALVFAGTYTLSVNTNQNNLSVPANTNTILLSDVALSGGYNITGIDAGGVDGLQYTIYNDKANNVVLRGENGGSLAANRFKGNNYTLQPDKAVTVRWLAAINRWIYISSF